jgi:hypothetical protein
MNTDEELRDAQYVDWFNKMGEDNPLWTTAHSVKMTELLRPLIESEVRKALENELLQLEFDYQIAEADRGFDVPKYLEIRRAALKEVKKVVL